MRERAILVDWDLYHTNPYTRDFVLAREGQARMILLVADPTKHDYTHPYDAPEGTLPHPTLNEHAYIEWDAVIRNTGDTDVVKFKVTALEIIKDVSNLDPVIGLDANNAVNKHYRSEGVLITIDDI